MSQVRPRSEVTAAITVDVLGRSEQVGAVQPAMEQRDLVPAPQSLVGHVTPEEDGPTEDEQAHETQPISCTCAKPRASE
jgi:hypothetical protein